MPVYDDEAFIGYSTFFCIICGVDITHIQYIVVHTWYMSNILFIDNTVSSL